LNSEDRGYLEDIVESARLAVSYVAGMNLEAFRQDQKTQDAVAYRVGIIGEAARLLEDETRKRLPLDWPGIIGMRHRLFHGYRDIKPVIVWTTVTEDLPALIELLREE
jgi:uncharacterized protein with HEPN domain